MDPYEFSQDELSGIDAVRKCLQIPIPNDLNTNFAMLRWWNGWKGQLHEIQPRLTAYIQNRRAAGLDGPEFIEEFRKHSEFSQVHPHLCFSEISPQLPVNSRDNSVVIVQRLEHVDYRRISRKFTTGQYLKMNFAFVEFMYQMVLRQERLSGRPSGILMLVDLDGMNMKDYGSPGSASQKWGRLGTAVMQEYYCNMLNRMIFINPPKWASIIWQLAKVALSEGTQRKMSLFTDPKDILDVLDAEILPKAFGGQRVDHSGFAANPNLCTNEPRQIKLPEESYKINQLWSHFGIKETPTSETIYIKPRASIVIKREGLKRGQTLVWSYFANAEITFALTNNNGELMTPRTNIINVRLPEEDYFTVPGDGDYNFEFTNVGSYLFSLKLELTIGISSISTRLETATKSSKPGFPNGETAKISQKSEDASRTNKNDQKHASAYKIEAQSQDQVRKMADSPLQLQQQETRNSAEIRDAKLDDLSTTTTASSSCLLAAECTSGHETESSSNRSRRPPLNAAVSEEENFMMAVAEESKHAKHLCPSHTLNSSQPPSVQSRSCPRVLPGRIMFDERSRSRYCYCTNCGSVQRFQAVVAIRLSTETMPHNPDGDPNSSGSQIQSSPFDDGSSFASLSSDDGSSEYFDAEECPRPTTTADSAAATEA